MSIKAETTFSLKDQLFNPETVGVFSSALRLAYPAFNRKAFDRDAALAFPDLELKARITFLADNLNQYLPKDFETALGILQQALPPKLDPGKTDDDFGVFIWSVPAEWIAREGCTPARIKSSLRFLREATMRFTAESAIRPFLSRFPEETLAFVRGCSVDKNYHVRRLSSEGIRPYLPWAERVLLPPETVIDVLSTLYADNTRYVTRSVANTMNDLSRVHPELVLSALALWKAEGNQERVEFEWIARHALRTLVNSDSAEALEFLGYAPKAKVRVSAVSASDLVEVGGMLEWEGQLYSQATQKLRLGLRVHYLKANGSHSAKLFAMKDIEAKKDESYSLSKRVQFKPATTRTLYTGEHHVELVVNGSARGRASFILKDNRFEGQSF